jgi:hypothetical protein
MRVGVEYRLAGLEAGVEDDPVSRAADPLGLGDLVRLRHNLREQPAVGAGERRQVPVMILGDDQDMRRRLGVDVPEGDGSGRLGNAHSGEVPPHDLAEKAVRHEAILACYPPAQTGAIYGGMVVNPWRTPPRRMGTRLITDPSVRRKGVTSGLGMPSGAVPG